MMREPVSLSIFFPAYNEEHNLAKTVVRTIQVAEESPYVGNYEIIIVNDGSTDGTGTIADELVQQHAAVRVVHHARNRGYGAALKSGIRAARKEYVFFTDADLQFDILELQNLLIHVESYDVVVGYRAPRQDPFMRLLNSWGWNILNRLMFGLRVRDVDCAFKLFKREMLQGVELQSRGAMISAETLLRLQRAGVAIKEVPVSHLPRTMGSPTGAKLSVIVQAFRELAMLYRSELGTPTHKEALKFMTVGVFNTLLDVSMYVLLTRTVPTFLLEPVAAKFFSYLLGTVSSLLLNRYWTFGLTSPLSFGEVVRFYTTATAALFINVSAMYVLVEVLGVYDLLALPVVVAVTFAFNFTVSKFWVFRPTERPAFARQS